MPFSFLKKKDESDNGSASPVAIDAQPEHYEKSFWQRLWPVLACGSGLFSDGYINNVIGSVSTVLGTIYGEQYTHASAQKNVSSISFAGAVVGNLIFGYLSDRWSRKNSLMLSTLVLFVFTALAAGSYSGGSVEGMFTALVVYRFFVGCGIGGEYPAGSVGAAEASGELKEGTRNRWFILSTDFCIDLGFVVGAFVPYICVVIFTENHLRAAWRVMLGLGCVCPFVLLFFRSRLVDTDATKKESMRKGTRVPYLLVLRFYGWRLFIVSFIWFLYNFSSYSFGIYSSTILANIPGSSRSLAATFGWNTVINLFYLPGAFIGAFLSDWLGPRYCLALGVTLQGLLGFGMAGGYNYFAQASKVGGFAVMYGLFLALGEVGPGANIGLLAAKTSATSVRGQYYGIAAAMGKIGAYVGTRVFPYIEAAGKSDTASAQYPFYVSSSFCILSAVLVVVCLPHIGQDTITLEDARFRTYLESKGWDTTQLGLLQDTEATMPIQSLPEKGGDEKPKL